MSEMRTWTRLACTLALAACEAPQAANPAGPATVVGDDADDGDGSGTPGDGDDENVGGADGNDCAATEASLASDVFAGTCTAAGCHGAESPAGGLDLSSDLAARLVAREAGTCDGWLLVKPGDPEGSLFLRKLAGDVPADCGDPMPPAGPALTAGELACVRDWIAGLDSAAEPEPPTGCETCGESYCVELASDAAHCGDCATACASGEICTPQGCDRLDCNDLPQVSYETDVAPLLAQHCTNAGCHAGNRPKEGLDLTESASFAHLVETEAAQCNDGRLLVEPGQPDRSYLLQKMLGVDMCSGSQMPKAGVTLPASDFEAITAWICQGAQP
jgi:hypothetical protein